MIFARLVLFIVGLCLPLSLHAEPCEGPVACTIGVRSYHVLPPDDWDGTTPMPLLLHFHGWGRQGDLIVNHRRIAGHTRIVLATHLLSPGWFATKARRVAEAGGALATGPLGTHDLLRDLVVRRYREAVSP